MGQSFTKKAIFLPERSILALLHCICLSRISGDIPINGVKSGTKSTTTLHMYISPRWSKGYERVQ